MSLFNKNSLIVSVGLFIFVMASPVFGWTLCYDVYARGPSLTQAFESMVVSRPNSSVVLGVYELIKARVDVNQSVYRQIVANINKKSAEANLTSQLEVFNLATDNFFKQINDLPDYHKKYLNDPTNQKKKIKFNVSKENIYNLVVTLKKNESNIRVATESAVNLEHEISNYQTSNSNMIKEIKELKSRIENSGVYDRADLESINQVLMSKIQMLDQMNEILEKVRKNISGLILTTAAKVEQTFDVIQHQLNMLEAEGIVISDMASRNEALTSVYHTEEDNKTRIGQLVLSYFKDYDKKIAVEFLNKILKVSYHKNLKEDELFSFEEIIEISNLISHGRNGQTYFSIGYRNGVYQSYTQLGYVLDQYGTYNMKLVGFQTMIIIQLLRRVNKPLSEEQLQLMKTLLINDIDDQIKSLSNLQVQMNEYQKLGFFKKLSTKKPTYLPSPNYTALDLGLMAEQLMSAKTEVESKFIKYLKAWISSDYRYLFGEDDQIPSL